MRCTRPVSIGLGAMLLLACNPQDAATAGPDSPSAAQILERVAIVYASCTSYRDAGVVQAGARSVQAAAGEQPAPEPSAIRVLKSTPFRTAFVRPGRFHFEFSVVTLDISLEKATYRYIVWQDGADVRTWWDAEPGVHHSDSLLSALFDAGLWSQTSTLKIPPMLMQSPDYGPVLVEGLAGTERLPNEPLDDVSCFVVKGKLHDTDTTLWIDQRTFLIRQIRSVREYDARLIETTTVYKPEINVDIGSDELAFDTPHVAVLPMAAQR